MLKLLTCAQGHYWETHIAEGADGSADNCPVCGQPAETMPLLDLAPSEVESTGGTPVPPAAPPLRDKEGRPIVAGYEILEDLGKGPTGLHLYKARQVLVNRTVVLKVVFAKEDPGQIAWGSLRGEASALGRLPHPNIVQILDAGERERQLFYNAVEHVEGPTLAEALDGKPLRSRQAVDLIETLARAVQQAHVKNIVHRSLKPASILLAMRNAECGMQNEKQASPPFCILHSAFCIPKITDFGLARRPVEGDASDAELQGELPCYLVPEQAWGRVKEIGPATDIYALGAILYELIAGQPPFHEATAAETLDAIQCREPPPPSHLRSGVSGDLDAICRKCLAKQPRRRYASALDLADDLRRCAAGHPIKARAAGNAERLGKWLRRNARGVAFVLLGLCLGAMLMALFKTGRYATAPPSRKHDYQQSISRLEAELLEARRQKTNADYVHYLLLAERAADGRENERGLEMLERCPAQLRHWEWNYLYGRLQQWNKIDALTTDLPITCMDLSRDGQYLAVGGGVEPADDPRDSRGDIAVWKLATRQRLWRQAVAGPVSSVAIRPDNAGLALVRAGAQARGNKVVEARHLQTGLSLFPPRSFTNCIPASVNYSADSRYLLVIADDSKLHLLQANNAAETRTQDILFHQIWPRGEHARLLPIPTSGEPNCLALVGPDGTQIMLLSDPWRYTSPTELHGHDDKILFALAYDPRNGKLAAGGMAKTIAVWDVRLPYQAPRILRGHTGAVNGLAFTSDGQRLASCGQDGTVRIWDVEQGLRIDHPHGLSGRDWRPLSVRGESVPSHAGPSGSFLRSTAHRAQSDGDAGETTAAR